MSKIRITKQKIGNDRGNITNEKLIELAEFFLDGARELLVRDNHLEPTAFIFIANDECAIMPLHFENSDGKNRAWDAVLASAKKKHAQAVFLLTDAWKTEMTPSLNRKEAIVLTVVSHTGKTVYAQTYTNVNGEYSFETPSSNTEFDSFLDGYFRKQTNMEQA